MTGPGPAEPPVECEICGRPLRTAESRRRRRGRTCDEKVNPDRGRDHSPQRLRVAPSRPARPRRAPAGPDEPTLFADLDPGS